MDPRKGSRIGGHLLDLLNLTLIPVCPAREKARWRGAIRHAH